MSKSTPNPMLNILKKQDILAVCCFFLSGFVGLVYEICWIRKASVSLGSTTLAISTVLAVFFGGLALGSYIFGNYSQKITRPLKVYAWLEILVGGLALVNPIGFDLGEGLFGLFYPWLENHFELLSIGRLVIVAGLLLPPCLLMGGTLPLFCKQYVRQESKITFSVGLLYGINTFGAAIGCLFCGYFLIPTIGVDQTIWLGGAVNILIGLAVLRIQTNLRTPTISENPSPKIHLKKQLDRLDQRHQHTRIFLVGILFFLSGFVALGNEIIWTRFFSLIIHNTVFTYTLTLAITLIGIVVGSLIAAIFTDRTRRRALLFGSVHLLTGMSILIVLLLPADSWKDLTDTQQAASQIKIFLAVLLVPSLLSGMSYPLAIRMVLDTPKLAGVQVGKMTAINTLGGILGSLLLGFLVVPGLGLQASLLLSTGMSVAIGAIAWLWLDRDTRLIRKIPVLAACALCWYFIPSILDTQLPKDYLAAEGNLVEFREGLRSHLAVVRAGNQTLLKIDRLWQGQDRKSHQIMAAHIPMLLHSNPKNIAVVGLGVGQTASRFLLYPIERLDCIEIERELLVLLERHFDSRWMQDPRAHFIIEDGRNYLSHTDKTYDIISIEVGQVFRPGLSSFYTIDFYRNIRTKLAPAGMVAQFVPIGFLDPQQFQNVIASFLEVFPKSVLYYNTYELLLMGSVDREPVLTKNRLGLLDENRAVFEDLKYAYWGGPRFWLNQPHVVLAGFLSNSQKLAEMTRGATIYTDTLPSLEYATARHQQIRSPQDILAIIHRHLSPLQAGSLQEIDENDLNKAEEIRKHNLGEIMATYLFQRSVTTKDITLLSQALSWNDWDPEINLQMGFVLAGRGKLDEALDYFEKTIQLDPDNIDAHINLGVIQLEKQQTDRAVFHLTQAVQLAPEAMLAHYNLARALMVQGDRSKAGMHFEKALRLAGSTGQTDWTIKIQNQIEQLRN